MHGICLMRGILLEFMNETFTLRSGYDGLDISVLLDRPEVPSIAVLQLAHGMRGCKERYQPFMDYMAAHGVVCIANDHRGHGSSVRFPEDRGYMYAGGYAALVADMKMVTDWAHERFPDLPVFLLGHSMGSLAARTYLKMFDDSVAGAIICGSPGDHRYLRPPAMVFLRLMNMFDDGWYRPVMLQKAVSASFNRRFRSEGSNAWTCSDPASRESFARNPFCSFYLTSNAIYALMRMMHETYSDAGWHMANPSIPLYFISGADDPCMGGESAFHRSAQHMADLGYDNVTSALFSDMRHEILNEKEKEMVWEDILEHIKSWI